MGKCSGGGTGREGGGRGRGGDRGLGGGYYGVFNTIGTEPRDPLAFGYRTTPPNGEYYRGTWMTIRER